MNLFLELDFVLDCIISGFWISAASLILALLHFIFIMVIRIAFFLHYCEPNMVSTCVLKHKRFLKVKL